MKKYFCNFLISTLLLLTEPLLMALDMQVPQRVELSRHTSTTQSLTGNPHSEASSLSPNQASSDSHESSLDRNATASSGAGETLNHQATVMKEDPLGQFIRDRTQFLLGGAMMLSGIIIMIVGGKIIINSLNPRTSTQ